jgi:hypothetical protein
MKRNGSEQLPEDEIARRMERGLRRALNTPPQPHGKNPDTFRKPKPSQKPMPSKEER